MTRRDLLKRLTAIPLLAAWQRGSAAQPAADMKGVEALQRDWSRAPPANTSVADRGRARR